MVTSAQEPAVHFFGEKLGFKDRMRLARKAAGLKPEQEAGEQLLTKVHGHVPAHLQRFTCLACKTLVACGKKAWDPGGFSGPEKTRNHRLGQSQCSGPSEAFVLLGFLLPRLLCGN